MKSCLAVGFGALALALAAVVAACVGDDPAPGVAPGDGGPGSAGDSQAQAAGDGGNNDGCVPSCANGSTLAGCDGKTTACQFECSNEGTPHCTAIQPTGIVPPEMLKVDGVTDVTLASTAVFFTDTGAIADLRAANVDPLKLEVKDGIGFRLVMDPAGHAVATWSFASLTVPAEATAHFTSAHPAALLATTTVTVVGLIDARGYDSTATVCGHGVSSEPSAGGPGGGSGELGSNAAGGPGGGQPGRAASPSSYYSGPSGGSYGGKGGLGGATGGGVQGADAGAPYGDIEISTLVGGSGGGGNGWSGGGGGGALQIVSGQKITIGGSAMTGGINAGGCGGAGGSMGNPGGAGGSGGSVLLEAPAIDLQPNGVIAANGGGGGVGGTGGGNTGAGQPGDLGALGGSGGSGAGSGYGAGGGGGAQTYENGLAGGSGTAATGSGGSGGGSVGRIRINNRTGTFTLVTGAILSPSKDIATNPPTTFGVLDVR